MADLVFAAKGQAEALAAQEAIAKKGREVRQEFEAGAKATQAWDSSVAKLARTAESTLRSIATEQERIASKIDIVNQAQSRGIISSEQAAEAVRRLREQWAEVDAKTQNMPANLDAVNDKTSDLQAGTDRLADSAGRAFDPAKLGKYIAGIVSIGAMLRLVKTTLDDWQTAVDKRTDVFLQPAEQLAKMRERQQSTSGEFEEARKEAIDLQKELTKREQVELVRRRDLEKQITAAREDLSNDRVQEREQREQLEQRLKDAEEDLDRATTEGGRIGAGRRIRDITGHLARHRAHRPPNSVWQNFRNNSKPVPTWKGTPRLVACCLSPKVKRKGCWGFCNNRTSRFPRFEQSSALKSPN